MKKGKIIRLKSRKKATSRTPTDPTDYATQWLDLPREGRLMFIRGFKDGFIQGCLDANKAFIHIHEDLLPAKKAIEIKAVDVACLDPEDIITGMSRLYLRGKHQSLPWAVICIGAISILEGTPGKEVGKSLASIARLYMESTEPNH